MQVSHHLGALEIMAGRPIDISAERGAVAPKEVCCAKATLHPRQLDNHRAGGRGGGGTRELERSAVVRAPLAGQPTSWSA